MSTAPGTYAITITGTSGSLVHTAVFTLTVALAVPDFTTGVTPTSSSLTLGRATSISYKLTLTPKFGFTGAITLSATGIPPGTTGVWKANPVSITSTSAVYAYYTLTVPSTAPASVSTITFTGTGGAMTHSVTATVTIK